MNYLGDWNGVGVRVLGVWDLELEVEWGGVWVWGFTEWIECAFESEGCGEGKGWEKWNCESLEFSYYDGVVKIDEKKWEEISCFKEF